MSEPEPSTQEMSPQYDPVSVEPRWASEWVERGYFEAHLPSDREPYCIVIPPPNVTGRLHVGHALSDTLPDVLIRRARMQGYETLWLPGIDHAGIATQVVVERELRKEGIDRRDIGREAFVERVWAWKEQYGGEIVDQIKRMGCSLDWSRQRFTMDEGLSRAVREAFVRWYDDGLIYRGERLVNWCPTDQTGLSDSEVEHEDVEGELVTFRYRLSDGSGSIACATTRVETMLGDTGIAVHPDDERYAPLIGTTVRHPFDGREIPIVADAAIDPAFGTGAVKVTPAHDPVDFDIAQRAGLPLMNIFRADATINENAAEEFYGLGRYDARTAVREELEKLDLIVEEIGRTSTPSAIATVATARSSRGSRACNGSSRSIGCGVRRRRRRSTAASRSGRTDGSGRTSSGWTTSATGTSPGSSGGATGSRRGTAPTATSRSPARIPTPARRAGPRRSSRTPMSSTRGSRRSCGPIRRSAGRTIPRTCGSSIRTRCWSRGTRSSTSGSPG